MGVFDGHPRIPADRLWVTIFETDDEAEKIWTEEVGVPAEQSAPLWRRITSGLWAIQDHADLAEIHWDRRPGESGDPLADDDRLLELWNVVFMQFERGDGEGSHHSSERH